MKTYLTEPYLLTRDAAHEAYVLWIHKECADGCLFCSANGDVERTIEAKRYPLRGLRIPKDTNGYTEEPSENPELILWQYIVKLENLKEGQTVSYRCRTGEEETKSYRFKTAPKAEAGYRFAQLSDLQCNEGTDVVLREIAEEKPDFLLYAGDFTHRAWHATEWFDLGEAWQSDETRRNAFFPCLQSEGVELLQRCPIFVCPGNHELDDLRVTQIKEMGKSKASFSLSIYMQIFRPFYEPIDPSLSGRRWYSARYGDTEIFSLSIQRCAWWNPYEAPGWRIIDSFGKSSPQYIWLKNALEKSSARFKWVILHWHLFNKGTDVQHPLCQPVISEDGTASYPHNDGDDLIALFEENGINAVSFGHSHVYERYKKNGIHYIEAAHFTLCYRAPNALIHPSGLLPVVEDNSKNSFLIVERNKNGLNGIGFYASSRCGISKDERIFDRYRIADENGECV